MTALNYDLLARQAEELIRSVPYRTANLANLSALLNDALTDINWIGFYLAEGDTLVLGPFQGKPACIEIPFGKGVCGTAAALDATQLVPDVHAFPGHIACDCASRSEIVIPMHCGGRVAAVLDIDSPRLARFTESDRLGLEALVRRVERYLFPTED